MVEKGVSSILEQSRDNWLRFNSTYEELLHERLQTVRAVKRFCAQADLYYSLVRGDVNGTDFLIISYLRLFFPGAYNCLPAWKNELTSLDYSDSNFLTWETRLSSAGVSSQDERIHVIKVLRTIFPNEFGSPSKFRSTGVSDPDYFDRYFLFGIPEGDVSDTQVITFAPPFRWKWACIVRLVSRDLHGQHIPGANSRNPQRIPAVCVQGS